LLTLAETGDKKKAERAQADFILAEERRKTK